MIDLHTHTTFSDGILSPDALVTLAAQRGVTYLSITDHDCIDAIPLAAQKARELGVALLPGVEINTDWREGEVHVLGYGMDMANQALQEKLQQQRESRSARLKAMLAKLQKLGFDLDENRVNEIAGKGAAGRPHLALALIEKKYVSTVDEAFAKFLGNRKPAWIPRHHFTPEEAIQMIEKAGGAPVLAHPGRTGNYGLEEFVAAGLKGIEVYYPTHTPDHVQSLLAKAKKFDLLVTGGSDYHGINAREEGPGCVKVPGPVVERVREMFEKQLIVSSKGSLA